MKVPSPLGGGRVRLFSVLVLNGVGQAAVAVGSAWAVHLAFSRLLVPGHGRPEPGQVATVAVPLVLAVATLAVLRYGERALAERLGQDYAHHVRMTLFGHVSHLPPHESGRRSTGATMLRFTGDLTALRNWLSRGLARLAVALPLLLGSLGVLYVVAPVLALAAGLVLAAGAGGAAAVTPGLREAARMARRQRGRLAARINERVARMSVVLAFGQRERERRGVDRRGRRLRAAMIARGRASGRLRAIAELTAGGATAAVVLTGVAAGLDPAAVAVGVTVVGFLAPRVRELARVQEYRQGARVATANLNRTLARPIRVMAGGAALDRGSGRLELDGVTVGGVLHQATATACPGQVIAITGPNGAGKSTLLAVAAGLLSPDAGVVCLDGQDMAGVDERDLRAACGLVAPDLPLLRGSVERNLRYRMPGAAPEEVHRVRKLVGLDDVLTQLPRRERTRLGEAGSGLSAGQRQRLALARALLGGPRLLLLDEPDTNLDAESLRVIECVLDEEGATVLMVTHHPDLLRRADTVWWLENGLLRRS